VAFPNHSNLTVYASPAGVMYWHASGAGRGNIITTNNSISFTLDGETTVGGDLHSASALVNSPGYVLHCPWISSIIVGIIQKIQY
jgi:hypothetical protein